MISYLQNILRKIFVKIRIRIRNEQLKIQTMSKFDDIKKFREQKGLTQKQLANFCGVTLRTVQNWEAGKTIPDNIVKLLQTAIDKDEIVSHTNIDSCEGSQVNSPVEQHVSGDGNNFSAMGDVKQGVSAELLQKALDEISEMRQLLAESVRNTNDLSQRIMKLLESKAI